MRHSKRIRALFAEERSGIRENSITRPWTQAQVRHNESLLRLERKLAWLLCEEEAERKGLRGTISEQNDTIKLYRRAADKYERLKDTLLLTIKELNRKVNTKELLNQELTRQIEELTKRLDAQKRTTTVLTDEVNRACEKAWGMIKDGEE